MNPPSFPRHKELLGLRQGDVLIAYGPPSQEKTNTAPTQLRKVGDVSYYYVDLPWGTLTLHFTGQWVGGMMVEFVPPLDSVPGALDKLGFTQGLAPSMAATTRQRWENLDGYTVDLGLEIDQKDGRPVGTGRVRSATIWSRPKA